MTALLFLSVFLERVAGTSNPLAYLDPGVGSIILQALIGLILGTLLAVKVFWYKIRSGLGRLFGKKPRDD